MGGEIDYSIYDIWMSGKNNNKAGAIPHTYAKINVEFWWIKVLNAKNKTISILEEAIKYFFWKHNLGMKRIFLSVMQNSEANSFW